MRKWNMTFLLLALLLLPAAGTAQELPELFSAVYDGIGEGLQSGVAAALAGMDQELTLEMKAQSTRVEEGKTVTLEIAAGNPRPTETKVSLALALPERLSAAPDAAWEAVLPAAQLDPQSGELVPSVTTFTREITLASGGGSEQAALECELAMGTRFYRAQTTLDLCVPDISVSAKLDGAPEGRLTPGDAFVYEIEVANSGTAPKDVELQVILPEGTALEQALPLGFAMTGRTIHGVVRAEAAVTDAAGTSPSAAVIRLPVRIEEDALEGDADAVRLMSGVLRADGERVAMPRIQVCDAKVSASLTAESEELEAGEETNLRIVVVNSGLVPADVRVSCVLPEGLTLAGGKEAAATPDEAALPPDDGDSAKSAADVAAAQDADAAAPAMSQENRTLVFELRMDAAKETEGGVSASTQVLNIPVRADEPQKELSERLVGTTLAWSVDDGQAQLGDALAMRVYQAKFLGIDEAEWNGIFWATLLLVVMVVCLYAAVRSDGKKEDFCCD